MCSAYFIRSSCHGSTRPSAPGKPGGDVARRWATMTAMDDYLEVNRANWDERAPAHAASPDYGFEQVRRRPRAPERRRALRPPAARRRRRADRHPPAVPHRHRHPLAGPPRRPDDGTRPVAGVARAGAAPRRRGRAARVDYVEADTYSAPQALGGPDVRPRLHRHRRPVLAARHRPVGGGRRRPPRPGWAAVRARGAPDDVGGRRRDAPTCSASATPTSRPPSPGTTRSRAPTSRPTPSSSTTGRSRGTTASARP